MEIYIYIYTPFHKPLTKDDIASKIPELVINNKLIEKKTFTKFWGVNLDEFISMQDYIKTVKNKVAKNKALINEANNYSIQVLLKLVTMQSLPGQQLR